jgi:hypothetical protein
MMRACGGRQWQCQQTVMIVRSTVVAAAGPEQPEKVAEGSWSGPRFCSD